MRPRAHAVECVRSWTRTALLLESAGPGGRGTARNVRVAGEPGQLVETVRRHRVGDLLHAHLDALDVPPDVADAVRADRAIARRLAMVQALELSRVAEVMDGAGLPWLALKGLALSVQTAGDATARGGGDLDLFVAPDLVPDVARLLVAHGWALAGHLPSDPRSWAWRHLLRSFHEMTFSGPTGRIDLHWRLDPTHKALPDFATAWSRRDEVTVAGVRLSTLGRSDALTHSCLHAARDDWRWLRSLVDVHRLARTDSVWADRPPVPLVSATLAVTQSCIGLPDGVPADVRRWLDHVPRRTVARAGAAQERPWLAANPVPAAQTLRDTRYRLSASPTLFDAAVTVSAALLPVNSMVDLPDRSVRTALPRLLILRIRWFCRRVASWAGRAVATPRRSSPGAT